MPTALPSSRQDGRLGRARQLDGALDTSAAAHKVPVILREVRCEHQDLRPRNSTGTPAHVCLPKDTPAQTAHRPGGGSGRCWVGTMCGTVQAERHTCTCSALQAVSPSKIPRAERAGRRAGLAARTGGSPHERGGEGAWISSMLSGS